MHKKNM